MGYLTIQYQLIKRCHFFGFTLTRRDSVFFLYNHYSKVQSTLSFCIGLKYSSNVLCLVLLHLLTPSKAHLMNIKAQYRRTNMTVLCYNDYIEKTRYLDVSK